VSKPERPFETRYDPRAAFRRIAKGNNECMKAYDALIAWKVYAEQLEEHIAKLEAQVKGPTQ
jgi:hypothetical protein